jgi:hypothetical protein
LIKSFIGLDFAVAIDFYGPMLKIERAEQHIAQLEDIFRQFVENNKKRYGAEGKDLPLGGKSTFPKHTPTILGDALHNLHAALDHAYHIVAEANNAGPSDYRRFPFGEDRQALEGSIKGHKKDGIAPSDRVITAILDEVQPYEGGKLGLYGLHKLDITDKHVVLIPTVSRMAVDQGLDVFIPGQPKFTFRGMTLQTDQGKGGEIVGLPVGAKAILHDNPEGAFQICFGRGQPFEGREI